MSDQPPQQISSNGQDRPIESSPHQPPHLRSYCHPVGSHLGKRSHEPDETTHAADAEAAAGTNHPSASSLDDSSNTDPAGGFTQHSRKSKRSIFSVDGAADKVGKRWSKPVAAVFIHAGAGYHSAVNEENHLKACSEAARVSMKALKGGRSAVEAVEAAIKVLENKEITNAGYGSNLAIDGTVECDATVVDHLGRSGACGAVPNVKNPIALARAILESSNKPLSLRRVPPNLLVGEGARDFAHDAGIELVTNEDLISKNARDRFVRWRDDLQRASTAPRESPSSPGGAPPPQPPPTPDQDPRKEHTSAILTATWNEGQPDSPATPSPRPGPQSRGSPATSPKPALERSPLSFLGGSLSHRRPCFLPGHGDEWKDDYTGDSSSTPCPGENAGLDTAAAVVAPSSFISPNDGASDERDSAVSEAPKPRLRDDAAPDTGPANHSISSSDFEEDMDRVTDTVGAIAIDQAGRIAAGSSSGGIGMKHRGRIGPAALVGVGTAVVPSDPGDAEGVSVAAVTSGTGEHMATTMASQRCAERLYQGSVRGAGGRDAPLPDDDDETALLRGFIERDFLGHPGVRASASPAAIGAMAVKKAPGGYYLYFAHNTESFALASMGSNDLGPACVMSRINEGGSSVAQGARKIRI
ncbi:putative threonine aspartase [Rosellinia necatrix]|uniref:Putative threonine aspartase n=1 Tax=Rosellinia necatrix TaxID=77044 RepID=A0A1W2TKA4_ROSNE|nr:putative threonine aspartase [Rosellinia necatrix]